MSKRDRKAPRKPKDSVDEDINMTSRNRKERTRHHVENTRFILDQFEEDTDI